MSNDENKNVLLRWLEDVNQGDITQLDKLADELFTADFMEHEPSRPDLEQG